MATIAWVQDSPLPISFFVLIHVLKVGTIVNAALVAVTMRRHGGMHAWDITIVQFREASFVRRPWNNLLYHTDVH